jgi:hypothetical protein
MFAMLTAFFSTHRSAAAISSGCCYLGVAVRVRRIAVSSCSSPAPIRRAAVT